MEGRKKGEHLNRARGLRGEKILSQGQHPKEEKKKRGSVHPKGFRGMG